MLRFLMWRLLGLLAAFAGAVAIAWLVRGGPGEALRGHPVAGAFDAIPTVAGAIKHVAGADWGWRSARGVALAHGLLTLLGGVASGLAITRVRARRRRNYVRLRVEPYRGDHVSMEGVVTMFAALHKRMLSRWWRRLLRGQPSISLEVHHGAGPPHSVWLAIACPRGWERGCEAVLRATYPNCRLRPMSQPVGAPPVVLRLKKHDEFIKRLKILESFEWRREPPVNRLLTALGACGESAFVQVAITPTPALFEAFAKHLFKRREARLSRRRRAHLPPLDRSMLDDADTRGGLEVQHRPLFFVDLRVIAGSREACERVASELRAEGGENHLVERGTAVRHGLLGLYARRVQRGEGNPLPSFRKGVLASTELAPIWHLPSVDYLTVPFARSALPLAPAPPDIFRPSGGTGTLRDGAGGISIHVELRKQNTAVPGTVEQGKSSYLVATIAEDLRRERCAVIVLDPKGDAADAAVSVVPAERTCTLLDLAHPTCGFNPLAVDAPADVIADYVVAALKNLFSDSDIRASSDRYLRNAIIAVLAADRTSTLWDAARLLSVGEEGYAYRSSVGARVRALPEFKEISEFFTAELTAQLADARSTTTAKLDAPVNKLARLLNSPSIKRVLLNDSLRVDFDRVIAHREVLVVKGALGAMGAGNTSVLMQLLVGMLDAALARQQDLVSADERVAVALKVDEAPLVINRGFAETMALKRSAGLETVACWQTDAQWTEREVRDQLDALFAHRVYFATASARDARAAASLTMGEFSDTIRPGIERLSALGHPDVRLHLPKHHAIASWSTPSGRQSPFIGETIPLTVDRERLALHAARQHARGARHRDDLRQPHWDRQQRELERSAPDLSPRASLKAAATANPTAHLDASEQAGGQKRTPADSYRELVDLDGAHSVRAVKHVESARVLEPDQIDLEMLTLIATMGHVLTSQVHLSFNAGRAATTTQRRLKRLAEAALVERFQFHRRDGGGIPMCYVIAEAGRQSLHAVGRLDGAVVGADGERRGPGGGASAGRRDDRLRQARHEVHVTGWALALVRTVGLDHSALRGPGDAVLSPPTRSSADGRASLGPSDLRLPGGRTPHGFLRTDSAGRRVEVERFETVRPDAILAVAGADPGLPAVDVIVELDDRLPVAGASGKLERYDHLLAGWCLTISRYGRRAQAAPLVVFVCRDRVRARACARAADLMLGACRAYAGEYPRDWQYPGREAILFVAERDVHDGLLCAYGVPRVPPDVRVSVAHGDPRAGEATAEQRTLLGRMPDAL